MNTKYDALYDVWYLFSRANRKFMRKPLLILFSLFTPIIFLGLFTPLFSGLEGLPGFPADGYLQFAVAGILIFSAFPGALQSGNSIIEDFDSGFLSKMLVTPVSRPAILLGRLLSDAIRISIQAAIILLLASLMGATFATGALGILLILLTVAFFAIAWSGVSLAVGLATKSAETVSGLSMFLSLPLLFVSTAFVPFKLLPGWMQSISSFNPINYTVDALRALTSTGFDWNVILPSYGLLAVISFLAIGWTVYRMANGRG